MKHRKPAPAWHRLGLKISKKVVVGITAAATAFGGLAIASTAAQASIDRDSYADTVENTTFEQARKHYGLAQQMSEGATLHAWEWSFKTIEENIPAIAEAGYTSVQTEPISAIHNGGKGMIFTENWYYVYQPTDTTIGNWVMGTEDDLKSLCNTAHKYGVRIIVDVVANHMTATWGAIADRWKKSEYYHHDCNDGDVQDWNNRYQVTHCKLLGLYDINTENTETANMMHDFLVQAVNDGVDGFRFDAAKHIELPDEYNGSQYWNIILNNGAQFQYGEVLQDSISRDSDYAKLFSSHSKNGGGVTASSYGSKLRGALNSKNLNAGTLSDWSNSASPSNLVSWVESHDNYSNSDRESTGMSEWQMTMLGRHRFPLPDHAAVLRPPGRFRWQPATVLRGEQTRRCRCGFLEGCAGRGGEPLPQYHEQQQGFGVSAQLWREFLPHGGTLHQGRQLQERRRDHHQHG